jgi:hypothetical protein
VAATATAALALSLTASPLLARSPISSFVPVTTYEVSGSVAEIVAATPDGTLLVYTDSEEREVGFVDIADPANPVEARPPLPVDGSPTSVAITPNGRWALIGVDQTDGDYVNPKGQLVVLSLASFRVVATHDVGGQPDSIAIDDDGRYAAIAIENERDEGVNDGDLPQSPAGFLAIVDLVGRPAAWAIRDVSLTGLPGLTEPSDPEPEYVDINHLGIAALTLQENNAVVLVRLWDGRVLGSWSAGVSTHLADLQDDGVISLSESLSEEREPDSIAWTPLGGLITANEGDWLGGSRDFTVFGPTGGIRYSSGATYEQHIVDAGLYDDRRSDNRGAEPEGVEVGRYGTRTFAFVGAERADAVVVYRLPLVGDPVFAGVLATGDRPEGLLAIPVRGLFVTANEGDGTISIFEGS